MTTVSDAPAGLAGLLSVTEMLLYAVETMYGDTDEGCDVCRIIMERSAFHDPYTIAKADSLEVMLNYSSDRWVRQFLWRVLCAALGGIHD